MKNWRYINGAEGIKIGNAIHTKEEAKTKDEYFKILKFYQTQGYKTNAGEYNPNGRIKLHKGDDSVEIILVGNSKVENYGVPLDTAGARQVREMAAKLWTSGMHNSRDIAMAIAFEIAKTSKAMQENKADVVSNIQDIIDRWIKEVKTGNDTPEEYAKRPPKIVGGNSLPEELEKDVEKKDKEKVEDIEDLKKTGNKEVYVNQSEKTKAVLYDDGTIMLWDKNGNNYKTIKTSSLEDARKKLNSDFVKVGNSDPILKGHTESELKNIVYTVRSDKSPEKKFKSRSEAAKYADSLVEQGHFGVHAQKEFDLGSMRYSIDVNLRAPAAIDNKKTVNSKTGNGLWYGEAWNGDSFCYYKDKDDNTAEVSKKVDKNGNASWVVTLKSGKSSGYGRFIGEYSDFKKAKNVAEDKVHAAKVGNSAYDDGAKKGKEDKLKGNLITAAGFEHHAPGYSSLSFKEKEEYKKGYYSTNDLKKEDVYKWGNSAQDDKFAYVMREFDEGKLKTPDGKVVTDPAQAKAIAYSESKKTENGLERARNAMAKNKKVGNSTRVVDQETIGGIRTYVFYDDSDDVYYVSDKGQGPLGNIFDNPSFKTKDEAKRYIKQRIS